MANIFDDMRAAVSAAEDTLMAADRCATGMAHLLRGRLRHCNSYDLRALKRELADFNIQTKTWKKPT